MRSLENKEPEKCAVTFIECLTSIQYLKLKYKKIQQEEGSVEDITGQNKVNLSLTRQLNTKLEFNSKLPMSCSMSN